MTVTEVAGGALLHFIWQGGVIALVTYVVLWVLRHQASAARYAVTCTALMTMLAMPVMTSYMLAGPPSAIQTAGNTASTTASMTAQRSAEPVDGEPRFLDFAQLQQAVTPGRHVLTLIVWFWAIGVALLTMRMAAGWWRVRRLHREAFRTPPSIWQRTGEHMAARLHLGTVFHIVDSDLVDTPAVVGWLRPIILLPLASLASLTPAQVEAILIHELAHIRRHDYLINLVQTVAETLLFYHPAVWWVSARIRAERENSCDDVAVQMCGDAGAYADALVQLESRRRAGPVLAPAATSGPLARRVRRLLHLPDEKTKHLPSAVLPICLAVAIVLAIGVVDRRQSALSGASQATLALSWDVRATDHVEIYHRPGDAGLVDRIATEAEAAYAQLRGALRHELAFKVALITLTAAEYKSVVDRNAVFAPISGGTTHIGPEFDKPVPRIVVPANLLDEQPRLLAHEMTHMFMFDLLPLSRWSRGVPVWLSEGLADHVAGVWTPDAVKAVRDTIVSRDVAPSELETRSPAPVDEQMRQLGHAVVDFIDSEFGQAGVRRFLFTLRSDSAPGGATAYETAFGMTPAAFDREFDRFMQERFSR